MQVRQRCMHAGSYHDGHRAPCVCGCVCVCVCVCVCEQDLLTRINFNRHYWVPDDDRA